VRDVALGDDQRAADRSSARGIDHETLDARAGLESDVEVERGAGHELDLVALPWREALRLDLHEMRAAGRALQMEARLCALEIVAHRERDLRQRDEWPDPDLEPFGKHASGGEDQRSVERPRGRAALDRRRGRRVERTALVRRSGRDGRPADRDPASRLHVSVVLARRGRIDSLRGIRELRSGGRELHAAERELAAGMVHASEGTIRRDLRPARGEGRALRRIDERDREIAAARAELAIGDEHSPALRGIEVRRELAREERRRRIARVAVLDAHRRARTEREARRAAAGHARAPILTRTHLEPRSSDAPARFQLDDARRAPGLFRSLAQHDACTCEQLVDRCRRTARPVGPPEARALEEQQEQRSRGDDPRGDGKRARERSRTA
jgi:hypothetical protein